MQLLSRLFAAIFAPANAEKYKGKGCTLLSGSPSSIVHKSAFTYYASKSWLIKCNRKIKNSLNNNYNMRPLIIILLIATNFISCRKWQDQIAINNLDLNSNLMQALQSNQNLSKFAQYVVQSGLDSVLVASKTITVWAPTNAALATLDAATTSNPVLLKAFILNHIANQNYFTKDAATSIRVPMMNGKFNNFSPAKFNDANLLSTDKLYKNGVLHTLDQPAPVLQNIWEFITTTQAEYAQNNFVANLTFNAFDPALAIIDSISSTTGLPIYRPGTGLVAKNLFNESTYNTRDENRQLTYFLIQDQGFGLESDSLKTYYKTSTPTSTEFYAKWNTVKDLVVNGIYPNTTIPLPTSRFGVPVTYSPTFIVTTKKMSNGVVHILSKLDIPNAAKFKNIVIEGEAPSGFLSDRRGNTNYRVRANPVTGQNFNDIMISGHGVTAYYAFYHLFDLPTMKYRVYAKAVNDFQAAAFTQSIIVKSSVSGTLTTLATLPYPVPLSSAVGAYNEVLLGEFTPSLVGLYELQATATTTGPIVLDYLRLEPVL
jgi:hypothetical protein